MSEFDRFSEGYRELLDRNVAISGETSEYFACYKARFIAEKVAPKPDCRILDYGCGIGLVCAQLKQHLPRARIDGYDVSRASLDHLDATLRKEGTFTSDTRDLVRDYDVVVLANVLHHVAPESRLDTVSRAAELLGVAGRLVIFEHNPVNPLTRRAVASCPFDKDVKLLSPPETLRYLPQKEFRKVRLKFIVFFPRRLRWLRAIEPFLHWCPLGAQYVVTGSKA